MGCDAEISPLETSVSEKDLLVPLYRGVICPLSDVSVVGNMPIEYDNYVLVFQRSFQGISTPQVTFAFSTWFHCRSTETMLVPPGTVVHITESQFRVIGSGDVATSFGEIIISRDCLAAHTASRYVAHLSRLARS